MADKSTAAEQMKETSSRVRVSAAALARVAVGERLALALNKAQMRRGRRSFSPFGGAIAASPAARSFLENSLGATFQELPMLIEGEEWVDLRLSLPEVNLLAFDEWFRRPSGREWGPERELLEELVETGVLAAHEAVSDRVLAEPASYLGMVRQRAPTQRPGREGEVTERYAEVFAVRLLPLVEERLIGLAAKEETVLLRTENEIWQGASSLGPTCVDLLPRTWKKH